MRDIQFEWNLLLVLLLADTRSRALHCVKDLWDKYRATKIYYSGYKLNTLDRAEVAMLISSCHGLKRKHYSAFVIIVCSSLNKYLIWIFRPFGHLFTANNPFHRVCYGILHGFKAKICQKIIPLQYRGEIIPLLSSVWTRFPDFVQYQGHVPLGAPII
jgi:hypothetical protein